MNICRICAVDSSQEFEVIFDEVESISDMMQELCNLQPSPDDHLPDVVCCACSTELRSALAFKRKCLDTDEKLREQLMNKIEFIASDITIHPDDTSNNTVTTPTISFKIIYEESLQPVPFEFLESQNVADEPEVFSTTQPEKLDAAINDFRCCGCESIFDSEELLLEHSSTVHEPSKKVNEERPYECGTCFRRYVSERGLKLHLRNAYETRHLQCTVCGKRFSKQHILDNHERIHSKLKPFACGKCPKSFRSRSNLLAHVKIHSEIPEHTRHVCQICSKGFSRKSYLKHHYILLHSEDTPFECSFCPSKFKAKANLQLHLRTHTQERPYSCGLCDKTFMYPTDKKRHMIQHTGQKPFKCANCGKGFTRKTLLQKHRLCHEAGENVGSA